MEPRDRRAAILQSHSYNGIDFVEIVDPDTQTVLNVHFFNDVGVENTLTGEPTITGGETIHSVAVQPIGATDWGMDDGHVVLTLRVAAPGDFSTYMLNIPSPVLDSFFDHVGFSFKANCPSDLDCQRPPPVCPALSDNTPPIDYLAKDFLSFRQALLDFSALRYPGWLERSEADFGMMFLEALSAVADDLSYSQDRFALEGSLVTATQRRSVVRHARLVDYEPIPAVAASVALRFDVTPGTTNIPHGNAVIASGPVGTPIIFETGMGLRDTSDPPPASALWNGGLIKPYWLDDSQRCLKAGATQMYVAGHGFEFQPKQQLLIETLPESSADPPIRQVVRLIAAGVIDQPSVEECDELFLSPVTGVGPPWMTCLVSPPAAMAPSAYTKIVWRPDDALLVDRDLTRTTISGNIAAATQGRQVTEKFLIGSPDEADPTPAATERTGPRPLPVAGISADPPAIQLFTLANSPVAWLPQPTLDPTGNPVPEILLEQANPSGPPTQWSWFRRLLDAGEFDFAFMLEAASYRQLGRNSDGTVQSEYDTDAGDTIRLGDGVFGVNPARGARFTVTCRYGAGAGGNVAADAINQLEPATIAAGQLVSVTNPLPATGGCDPQPLQSVQRLAPQAFQAEQFRAVLPADYNRTAETLPWVARAGAVFRWTGSWLTAFTTPDPRGSEQIATDQRIELIDLLNRRRMTGYESYVPDPDYVSIDLAIDVCATPDMFAGAVEAGIIDSLAPSGPIGGRPGFFAPDNFTFGQPLERSALEGTIQGVPGVAGVTCIRYRVRGRFGGFTEMGDTVPIGTNQIIRCDNNPSRPERGAFSVIVGGGR